MQHHARVGAQFPIELAGADIDRMDAHGSGLEQNVGESAGGGADIEAGPAGDIDGEVAERAGQLEAAAAHVGRAREDLDATVIGDGLAGLGGFLPVDEHLAGHDQGLGFLAGFGEPAFHNEPVQPGLHRWGML